LHEIPVRIPFILSRPQSGIGVAHTVGLALPTVKPLGYRIVVFLFRIIFGVLSRCHVTGLENVPERGPFIVVNNHLSYIDSPLLGIAVPHMVQPLAAEKYERHLIFRLILEVAGPIFIDRGEVDRVALRQALKVLGNGGPLAIAIEGTRSKTGGLIEGKTGAAYFATRANVPLLPVVLYGSEQFFSNLLRLRRTDVYVAFGPLIHLPEGRARSEQLDAHTEHIMLTLAAMLPEQNRGVYADHPHLQDYLSSDLK
jgi:1-acyl-sn-glycerol-3-phosphate acyltransferase